MRYFFVGTSLILLVWFVCQTYGAHRYHLASAAATGSGYGRDNGNGCCVRSIRWAVSRNGLLTLLLVALVAFNNPCCGLTHTDKGSR